MAAAADDAGALPPLPFMSGNVVTGDRERVDGEEESELGDENIATIRVGKFRTVHMYARDERKNICRLTGRGLG